jgi:hypothetical protein
MSSVHFMTDEADKKQLTRDHTKRGERGNAVHTFVRFYKNMKNLKKEKNILGFCVDPDSPNLA